ncbi:hypothetical protein ACFQBY_06420 [Promicromonospora citrea]|nr:hypothetical protein [Promicromonospora citrea]NNH52288.1 hypothetical protein [Promicromonospora citrea]
MPASFPLTRRRLVLGLALVLVVVAAVVAAFALRGGVDPVAAGASASPSATVSPTGDAPEGGTDDGTSDGGSDDDGADEGADAEQGGGDSGGEGGKEGGNEPAARETLEPRPFDAEATPQPGVTVAVAEVEKVEGEANLPGEVGGPALRFTIDVTNGTGETLDLRTIVVNAYYGADRTPANQLLKPGGKAFEAETADGRTARGAFVFTVPADQQDRVELEVDPGIGSPVIIFTGA